MQVLKTGIVKLGILITGLVSLNSTAIAHSPYLLPNMFDFSEGAVVTLDATMGEYFFVPDRAFTDSSFSVMLPDGRTETPENLVEFKTRTVLEHTLEMPGTYRISTGWRVGGIVKSYELDGRTRRLRGEDTVIPEGGELLSSYRSSTMAEAFVTQGAPTEQVLMPKGEGLEFLMQSHPNELFAGEEVNFTALLEGNAASGVVVDVFLAARQAEGSEGTYSLQSNEHGALQFVPELAGIYILKSRHTVPSIADSDEPDSRFTYTMVFEVTE